MHAHGLSITLIFQSLSVVVRDLELKIVTTLVGKLVATYMHASSLSPSQGPKSESVIRGN
jgi:hypothetical protein